MEMGGKRGSRGRIALDDIVHGRRGTDTSHPIAGSSQLHLLPVTCSSTAVKAAHMWLHLGCPPARLSPSDPLDLKPHPPWTPAFTL